MTAPAATLTPAVTQLTPPATPPVRTDDLITRLIAQHGSAENAMRHLVTASVATEQELTTLRAQVHDYRTRLPEGSVILPKAEAENMAKLKALGTVDEIVAGMKERDTLKGTVTTATLTEQYRAAAAAAQVDADALADYGLRVKLPIEMRDATVKVGSKTTTTKVPFTRNPADEKAAWVPVADYIGTLPAFEQRALRLTATSPATGASATSQPYPQQGPTPTGKAATGDAVADFIAERDRRNANVRSPLFPSSPTPAVGQPT